MTEENPPQEKLFSFFFTLFFCFISFLLWRFEEARQVGDIVVRCAAERAGGRASRMNENSVGSLADDARVTRGQRSTPRLDSSMLPFSNDTDHQLFT